MLFKFTGKSIGMWEEIEPVPAILYGRAGRVIAMFVVGSTENYHGHAYLFSGEHGYEMTQFPGKRLKIAYFHQLTILTDDCLMEV